MPTKRTNEETPLLADERGRSESPAVVKKSPFPWGQFSILLVLQLAEPLTSQVIYPFLPQVRLQPSSTCRVTEKISLCLCSWFVI
jgi:hypothetical protein